MRLSEMFINKDENSDNRTKDTSNLSNNNLSNNNSSGKKEDRHTPFKDNYIKDIKDIEYNKNNNNSRDSFISQNELDEKPVKGTKDFNKLLELELLKQDSQYNVIPNKPNVKVKNNIFLKRKDNKLEKGFTSDSERTNETYRKLSSMKVERNDSNQIYHSEENELNDNNEYKESKNTKINNKNNKNKINKRIYLKRGEGKHCINNLNKNKDFNSSNDNIIESKPILKKNMSESNLNNIKNKLKISPKTKQYKEYKEYNDINISPDEEPINKIYDNMKQYGFIERINSPNDDVDFNNII